MSDYKVFTMSDLSEGNHIHIVTKYGQGEDKVLESEFTANIQGRPPEAILASLLNHLMMESSK